VVIDHVSGGTIFSEVDTYNTMPGKKSNKRDLDDIQVLGVWNFTIQPETPLVWLRTGPLDRYLLRFVVHSDMPSTAGMIFHSEADGPGIDGVSFWIERRQGADGEFTRRYVMAGEGLDSRPIASRKYPDTPGEAVEDIEVLVQGFTAVVFVRNRQVQLRCRTKVSRGSICFFNSTKSTDDGLHEDVHFSNCRITALRRGPLEVGGTLAQREKALADSLKEPPPEEAATLDPLQADGSIVYGDGEMEKGGGFHESVATTAPPDSPGISTHLSKSGAATTTGPFFKAGASPGVTRTGFRHTATTRGAFGKSGSPNLTNSNAMFHGRPGASPARLRPNLSDSALRKSGSALCGLSSASKVRGFGDDWVPLTMNPPTSQQKFCKDHAIKPSASSKACQDFIKWDEEQVT